MTTPAPKGRIKSAYRAGHPVGRYPGWAFTLEYDEAVIETLKATVPAVDRSYDPETHEWWVDQKHEAALVRLFPGFEAHLRQMEMFS